MLRGEYPRVHRTLIANGVVGHQLKSDSKLAPRYFQWQGGRQRRLIQREGSIRVVPEPRKGFILMLLSTKSALAGW